MLELPTQKINLRKPVKSQYNSEKLVVAYKGAVTVKYDLVTIVNAKEFYEDGTTSKIACRTITIFKEAVESMSNAE